MNICLIPHNPTSLDSIRALTDRAQQQIVNATICGSQYADPAYRAARIHEAIQILKFLHTMLSTDATINRVRYDKGDMVRPV